VPRLFDRYCDAHARSFAANIGSGSKHTLVL
jgi:hypothetical protein